MSSRSPRRAAVVSVHTFVETVAETKKRSTIKRDTLSKFARKHDKPMSKSRNSKGRSPERTDESTLLLRRENGRPRTQYNANTLYTHSPATLSVVEEESKELSPSRNDKPTKMPSKSKQQTRKQQVRPTGDSTQRQAKKVPATHNNSQDERKTQSKNQHKERLGSSSFVGNPHEYNLADVAKTRISPKLQKAAAERDDKKSFKLSFSKRVPRPTPT